MCPKFELEKAAIHHVPKNIRNAPCIASNINEQDT